MSSRSLHFTQSSVRIRFAPSPTGYLHVGGARTALYCYLVAKKLNGTFILRMEDTDEARSTEEFMRLQMDDLAWLGLKWDEGPDRETLQDQGTFGPYLQSRRQFIYNEYAQKLIDQGMAYYCFLTDEEMAHLKEDKKDEGDVGPFISPYRQLCPLEAKAKLARGERASIRFKTPEQRREYVLQDLIRGAVVFPSDMVGDFVLVRSTGMPVYNFCCVVDDALMKISHVLRAEEHLSNTVRQMMIYEALNFPLPQFGHLSIILGPDKQKLSKRHGATSCEEYRRQGYLPEAINNFIALLGWSSSSGKEILSMSEMINEISLNRFHSSPAVFDEVKLKWVNAQHLRGLCSSELWNLLKPFFAEADLQFPDDEQWQDRVLQLMKPYMETLKESVELFRPLAQDKFQIDDEADEALHWESSERVIREWLEILSDHSNLYLQEEEFLAAQERIKQNCNVKGKFLFMPIRVAVLGKPQGAELKILVPLLEKEVLVMRAEKVLARVLTQ